MHQFSQGGVTVLPLSRRNLKKNFRNDSLDGPQPDSQNLPRRAQEERVDISIPCTHTLLNSQSDQPVECIRSEGQSARRNVSMIARISSGACPIACAIAGEVFVFEKAGPFGKLRCQSFVRTVDPGAKSNFLAVHSRSISALVSSHAVLISSLFGYFDIARSTRD
jgi:hypothetical protein